MWQYEFLIWRSILTMVEIHFEAIKKSFHVHYLTWFFWKYAILCSKLQIHAIVLLHYSVKHVYNITNMLLPQNLQVLFSMGINACVFLFLFFFEMEQSSDMIIFWSWKFDWNGGLVMMSSLSFPQLKFLAKDMSVVHTSWRWWAKTST